MLIHEAGNQAGLTKKAIEYYTEQHLVFPGTLENGYKDFDDHDVELLKKIAVLRKLGLGIEAIRAVLQDATGSVIRRIALEKELTQQKAQKMNAILNRLSKGESYHEAAALLKTAEQGDTIAQKLLNAFPGFYGRFVCLHFMHFLNEPILTAEQQDAYLEVVRFLDDVKNFPFPEDLRLFFEENMNDVGTDAIMAIQNQVRQSVENPETFIEENKDTVFRYMQMQKAEAFQDPAVNRVKALLKEYSSMCGYNDVFLKAMRRLSPAYAAYSKSLELANHTLLQAYPELAGLNEE